MIKDFVDAICGDWPLNGDKVETPEIDKLSAIQEQSQIVGEFLDWMMDVKRYSLVVVDPEDSRVFFHPSISVENLLAEYFDIDLKKVEKEKQSILEMVRRTQNS